MYFTSSDQQILKQGILTKRAQGKSGRRSIISNYKTRLFVLTPTELSYFEGTGEVKELKIILWFTVLLCVDFRNHFETN